MLLMDINCSAVTSVNVHLKFTDNSTKDRTISKGDLIEVEFHLDGLRHHVTGRVLKVYAPSSTDPKNWYIMVDSSDACDAAQYRFCPMNILDIEILLKADAVRCVETPKDITGIKALRAVKGRLQFTMDGINWLPVVVDRENVIIDESGTCPDLGLGETPNDPDDVILDEVQ